MIEENTHARYHSGVRIFLIAICFATSLLTAGCVRTVTPAKDKLNASDSPSPTNRYSPEKYKPGWNTGREAEASESKPVCEKTN